MACFLIQTQQQQEHQVCEPDVLCGENKPQ